MKRLLLALLIVATWVPAPARADGAEAKMGAQIDAWLVRQGRIVAPSSPLYATLDPITAPLKAVAGPRYDEPFTFAIGRDTYPNVASVPGGRVYVSEKAFEFLTYREELAGALCHAVAHTVRHDYANLARKNANGQLAGVAVWAAMLSGNPWAMFAPLAGKTAPLTNMSNAAIAVAGVATLAAADKAERGADALGAELCADAGLNPWGLVWLLQNYRKSQTGGRMEMLTGSPAERVRALEAHFASDPARFGRFDPDRAHGTPLRP